MQVSTPLTVRRVKAIRSASSGRPVRAGMAQETTRPANPTPTLVSEHKSRRSPDEVRSLEAQGGDRRRQTPMGHWRTYLRWKALPLAHVLLVNLLVAGLSSALVLLGFEVFQRCKAPYRAFGG